MGGQLSFGCRRALVVTVVATWVVSFSCLPLLGFFSLVNTARVSGRMCTRFPGFRIVGEELECHVGREIRN